MAQKVVNRSAAIRELYAQYPKLPVKDAVALLAQQGVGVTEALVYIVRKKMKRKARRQARVKTPMAVSTNGDPLAMIKKIKAVAADVGGMNKLEALIEALS
jgi:hypothetical protein